MSGAQSWSVKGIDPKVREAAREAAARQGMTLGEYLSLALQGARGDGAPQTPPAGRGYTGARTRSSSARFGSPAFEADDEDDWHVSGPTTLPRVTDPVRLAQRIESIERRTQLAVSGLDRAVSTIDRSVLGLAARIEDAEALSGESADRIADALEQFRIAGDMLSGRLQQAETEVAESRTALNGAKHELASAHNELATAKERLEGQVAIAEEVARRAEAAASFLTTELENRDAAIGHKLGALEDQTREGVTHALSAAREAAEDAARQAAEASADAVNELRRLQERMAERLTESENSARRAVEAAIEETRAEQAQLGERTARAETEARGAREALLEEVVRLESEIANRIAAAEQLKSEQQTLISRIERAEAGARESTAGLRQAAGAAIADLRNAQLGLAARLKQVEETAGRNGALDLADVRQQQQDIAERLANLETKSDGNLVGDALAAFEKRIASVEAGDQVKTIDGALERLAARLVETENTANTAIRTLEETVSSLGAKVEANGAAQETEALRAMLESRLDTMAQHVTQMVGQAQNELTGHVHAALEGIDDSGLEGALADVNRRLAAAERRQAQTIEAISIEIKRMSESVDARLRSVEARNDDAAGSAVREELTRMTTTLEKRFDEIERREAGAFDRMGLEVGRLSERLEERVGAVEGRSAQAIEQVGEQVARMAERFNQRHEILSRELGERMLDSEERAGARVSEAISSIMQRLSEVETHSAEAIAPVQKAVSSVAERLQEFQTGKDEDDIQTPSRRFSDFDAFGDPEPFASPMEAAQPTRAAPLASASLLSPPAPMPAPAPDHPPVAEAQNDHDIYFAEEIADVTPPLVESYADLDDDLLIDDPLLSDAAAFAPEPAEDDDPFWTPDTAATPLAQAHEEETQLSEPARDMIVDPLALDLDLDEPAGEAKAPGKNDYLANARRAAQAASQPAKPAKARKEKHLPNHEVAPTPQLSLRGSSRIVLWGAASAIVLAIAGGAWYVKQNQHAQPAPTQPEPAVTPTTANVAPPVQSYDPDAPFGQPVADPFANQAPSDRAAPSANDAGGGPAPTPTAAGPATQAPVVARNATPGAANTSARQVAGPLPTRNLTLEQAAQSGDLVAQYELALQRLSSSRTADGVNLLRRAADRGLAMAQYRLAKLYERGEGVSTDLTVARQWTERAAAGGNRRAMHDLGVYFARGEGAPLDEAAAFRWFRQAAELGVADSQYNLGVLYQQGRGVGASASEAMFWFLVAARQGDNDASARAQAVQATLQPNQVEQARARAQAFRPRAASAQANGEFGARPWTTGAAGAVATRPAT